jgi:hypothetical protein
MWPWRVFPGSTGCQPVLFGSLPKSSSNVRSHALLQRSGCRRQAADDSRLAACAPQATELLEMIADDLEDHDVIDHAAEIVRTRTAAKRYDILDRVESCF